MIIVLLILVEIVVPVASLGYRVDGG